MFDKIAYYLSASLCLSLWVMVAHAEPEFVAQIPNAMNVPTASAFGCDLCHTSAGGGGNRNPFGNDAFLHHRGRTVNWSNLCPLDSDGDGFTNGQELADPECQWVTGNTDPLGEVSHPGDANSVLTEIAPEAGMEAGAEAGMVAGTASMMPVEASTDQGCNAQIKSSYRSFLWLFMLVMASLVARRRWVQ